MAQLDYTRAAALLEGLVRIPSLSLHEAEASRWLVEQMQGLAYTRAYVDEVGNAVGEIGDLKSARHLIVMLGHIDTVPGNIPVRIETVDGDKFLYGRGSVDAKGPLATFTCAAALIGEEWARQNDICIMVVGAVEEEYATSRGARHIGHRFVTRSGQEERHARACIIGEPSGWNRVTLGYKGRILVEVDASRPMAHTAGPDAGVATVAVAFWNFIEQYAATHNEGIEKVFDQFQPSLRKLRTWTDDAMHDRVVAEAGIRLPLDFPIRKFMVALEKWAEGASGGRSAAPLPDDYDPHEATVRVVGDQGAIVLNFRGYERAFRCERTSPLARAIAAGIRTVDPDAKPAQLLKTGTSDMNVVGWLWEDCPIVAYGPGDSALDHTPNEHISLAEYWKAVQVLVSSIRDFSSLFLP